MSAVNKYDEALNKLAAMIPMTTDEIFAAFAMAYEDKSQNKTETERLASAASPEERQWIETYELWVQAYGKYRVAPRCVALKD